MDTHVLIWGIKGEAEPGQEDMIGLAQSFLEMLETRGVRVIVPSPVVFELLMRIPASGHAGIVDSFRSNFEVVPFDVMAASEAARIWYASKRNDLVEGVIDDLNVTRREVKVDTMIVGTALARGAFCIYSHDGPLKRLATPHIPVQEVGPGTQMDFISLLEGD